MIISLVLTATIFLAFISAYPIDRGSALRPQAIQMLQEKIGETSPDSNQAVEESDSNATASEPAPSLDNPPSVAGTSNKADSNVKQVIEKDITSDSVKVKIEQKVDSNQPVRNKVNVKIDTGQDPPLVQISTQPTIVNCSVDSYDCADFTTCPAATNVYNACSTDIHELDPDNNGTPCDGLCTSN
ncbi:MAG: hypothetical protein A3E37_01495 [Candidatus Andersenbacteria bacterium RIFCSPHIGHO2_12_FULL_46_9]|nr:MAG: hypothetical protein UW94_C0020G0018 [Parcubacteria group bacterium GW2011_GWA2_45_14]OGY35809.1 MAG: hypothetical protein A3E37_01495 [Candidatus Andersenbacteria bacterium RIFCSPHIGHO2_12_FULL_46_9]OGY35953.1 MAG: hypothetical protein A3B76_04230 [Candidatus Andersenbacteria bacterium RIFCSPHIGHO2_02_FULL_46_16]OGY38999.1 MAG: hypothetical protein A3G57_03750 [Candidatus Andersenbacteria bacterium RIFCSPLOWO2_12_FULL_45_8]HBE89588.1 hypothetical protein [Candidatus Andersenbacteria ba